MTELQGTQIWNILEGSEVCASTRPRGNFVFRERCALNVTNVGLSNVGRKHCFCALHVGVGGA